MTATTTTENTITPTFVRGLLTKYQHSSVWPYINKVMPLVLFEVMALGPDGLIGLGKITAKLRLDDGKIYKLRFDHATHELQLRPMTGQKNGPPVATFTNKTTQRAVWKALHPKEASGQAFLDIPQAD